MRWTFPEFGATRIRKGFLWSPRCIGNEIRWLEQATWEQWCGRGGWVDIKWI